jgi:Xaa-Pro aminopeptidase
MNYREISEKVSRALDASQFDAILVAGADNVQYLSGVHLPFLPYRPGQRLMVVWRRGGEPALVCPAELGSTARHLGWVDRVHTYASTGDDPAGAAGAVAGILVGAPRTLGLDTHRAPWDLYQALQQALPGVAIRPCDGWLDGLRMCKTGAELERLEEAAYATDHALNATLHHVVVASPRTQLTEAEEVRVHCLERGLEATGYHAAAQVAGGGAARDLWPLCPAHGFNYGYSSTGRLAAGQMVRASMRAVRDGYWSDACRILVMGQPSPEQAAAYADLVALREAMMARIRPGVACNTVFAEAREAAMARGIDFLAELGAGHGVGAAAEEGPYLAPDDDTQLQPGMVLVLAPTVRGPEGELLCAKDTVVVTEDGCRLAGWWKDWREPYIPIEVI